MYLRRCFNRRGTPSLILNSKYRSVGERRAVKLVSELSIKYDTIRKRESEREREREREDGRLGDDA